MATEEDEKELPPEEKLLAETEAIEEKEKLLAETEAIEEKEKNDDDDIEQGVEDY